MKAKNLLTISVIFSLAVCQTSINAFAEEAPEIELAETVELETNDNIGEPTETGAATEEEETADSEEPLEEENSEAVEISEEEAVSEEKAEPIEEAAEDESEMPTEEDLEEEELEEDELEEEELEEEAYSTLSIKVLKPETCFNEHAKSSGSYLTSLENSCSFDVGIPTIDAIQAILSPKYNSAEYKAITSTELPEICPEDLVIKLYMDEDNNLEAIDVSYTEENNDNENQDE